MMEGIKLGGKNAILKYSFNSFKYMEDLDLSVMNELENKPFKIIGLAEMMLMGAVNNDPRNLFTVDMVQEYLEKEIADGKLMDLLTKLMELLQESDFFKSLQVEK